MTCICQRAKGRLLYADMDFRELEETLCRLPSVDAVRVVGDDTGIAEVHVLSPPEKPAKQVVRDIQSLAMARFGATIDRRSISVVQLAVESHSKDGAGERPRISKIEEIPGGSRTTVEVSLDWKGTEYSGSSDGPSAPSARLRLLGEATLRAMEEVIGGSAPLALDSIADRIIGNNHIIVAIVVSTDGSTESVLVGTAMGRGDEAEAAVRAVLDALNRRMPQLLR